MKTEKTATRSLMILLALTLPAIAGALDVEQGDIRLTLHENSARFSLAIRDSGSWDEILFPEDPRTTSLDVLEGNQVHRMGDSGDFSQEVEETADGARFTFESPTLRVIQEFQFTRGVDASRANAVEMRVSVTNRGEAAVITGVRLLYDTYLGEQTNLHFLNSSGQQISGESTIEPGVANQYVQSVATRGASSGFQLMLTGERVTAPERVIVANWQRLSESNWSFEVNTTRNFNRLPYSINDSALLVLYPTVQLASNQTATYVTYLGDLAAGGYVDPARATTTGNRVELLAELTALIERINALTEADSIDADTLARLQAELESLRERIAGQ